MKICEFVIERESGIPLYIQLKNEIKRLIEEDILKPGDAISPEREISERYHISRTSVRQALTELAREGIISRIVGRGTFVNNNILKHKIRRKTIAAVFSSTYDFSHPSLYPQLRGAEKACSEWKANLQFFTVSGRSIFSETDKSLYNLIKSRQIDGLLFFSPISKEVSTFLKSIKIPFVLVNNELEGEFHYCVITDHFNSAYIGTRHLIDLGHQHIGFIGGFSSIKEIHPQLEGYKNALEQKGIPFNKKLVREGEWGEGSGYTLTEELLEERPTALLIMEDLMAAGAYKAIKKKGLNIPKDISIIGCGNFDFSPLLDPPLTTLDTNAFERGRVGTDMLLKIIKGDKDIVIKSLIPPRLIIRNSCDVFL